MELIKNKKDFLDSANEVINECGTPAELANTIEELIFSYMENMCNTKRIADVADWNLLWTAKKIKGIFTKIELIERIKQ